MSETVDSVPSRPKTSRDETLDFLRGSAVLFMIVCHAFVLLYSGKLLVMDLLVFWGATVCFTIFLFVFSVIYARKINNGRLQLSKELRRVLTFIVGYFIVAFWVVFWSFPDVIKDGAYWVFRVLSLYYMPAFTEFVITFAWFVLLFLILQRPIKAMLKRMSSTVIVTATLYVLAGVLYTMTADTLLWRTIGAQLVGFRDFHIFGVLSYMPVAGFGLWWGSREFKDDNVRMVSARNWFVVLLALFVFLRVTGLSSWHRWPPSIYFMLYGFTFTFLAIWQFDWIKKLGRVYKFVLSVGKNAFVYYLGHLLILMPLFKLTRADLPAWLSIVITIATVVVIALYIERKRLLQRLTKSTL
ncbi:hypothetical protein KC614_03835 [candidate division WWE3 bacterium]|uniref:Acyltransferase 3 domain-containing protein n=1 Tax=candidate division WWE3 bacterium TaxID=2053526 RepID=A0A955RSB6_UNCKA|nr:hypothetical protein [candidate division WWE3 bacterium]